MNKCKRAMEYLGLKYKKIEIYRKRERMLGIAQWGYGCYQTFQGCLPHKTCPAIKFNNVHFEARRRFKDRPICKRHKPANCDKDEFDDETVNEE